MKNYALIVAGGSGSRMGSGIPKQFLLLHQKPVLMHTMEAFYAGNCAIILVLPSDYITFWEELCQTFQFQIPHQITTGGDTRSQSVQNGLACISDEKAFVGVHDAARPLVKSSWIQDCFHEAIQHGNAVPMVLPKDSLRKFENKHTHAVDRNAYRIVQTPQIFNVGTLKNAFRLATHARYTDEASLVEEVLNEVIFEVSGDYENIKITTPEDLIVAEAILKKRIENVNNE